MLYVISDKVMSTKYSRYWVICPLADETVVGIKMRTSRKLDDLTYFWHLSPQELSEMMSTDNWREATHRLSNVMCKKIIGKQLYEADNAIWWEKHQGSFLFELYESNTAFWQTSIKLLRLDTTMETWDFFCTYFFARSLWDDAIGASSISLLMFSKKLLETPVFIHSRFLTWCAKSSKF